MILKNLKRVLYQNECSFFKLIVNCQLDNYKFNYEKIIINGTDTELQKLKKYAHYLNFQFNIAEFLTLNPLLIKEFCNILKVKNLIINANYLTKLDAVDADFSELNGVETLTILQSVYQSQIIPQPLTLPKNLRQLVLQKIDVDYFSKINYTDGLEIIQFKSLSESQIIILIEHFKNTKIKIKIEKFVFENDCTGTTASLIDIIAECLVADTDGFFNFDYLNIQNDAMEDQKGQQNQIILIQQLSKHFDKIRIPFIIGSMGSRLPILNIKDKEFHFFASSVEKKYQIDNALQFCQFLENFRNVQYLKLNGFYITQECIDILRKQFDVTNVRIYNSAMAFFMTFKGSTKECVIQNERYVIYSVDKQTNKLIPYFIKSNNLIFLNRLKSIINYRHNLFEILSIMKEYDQDNSSTYEISKEIDSEFKNDDLDIIKFIQIPGNQDFLSKVTFDFRIPPYSELIDEIFELKIKVKLNMPKYYLPKWKYLEYRRSYPFIQLDNTCF